MTPENGLIALATGDTQGQLPFAISTDYDVSGGFYGLQVGYNWQRGHIVYGIEGSWSHSTVAGDTACVIVLNCRREVDWVATVVGRAGVVFDRTLIYGMAGVAWGEVNTDVRIIGFPVLAGSDTHVGWVAGFGFEHVFSNRISARIEYAHIDLGSNTQALTPVGLLGGLPSIPDRVDLQIDTIRLGINVKLTN